MINWQTVAKNDIKKNLENETVHIQFYFERY